ncbi:SDR family oxidoreductase [Nonomuraea sp. NN258]|uniref:SDR family oxidoreductase n=1 Tax=Nonomuraea antri TaxID=2730852 RepID=UPI001569FECA|nr:SDR family oxidoreductase [Nonomuraea antri]NRQ39574.1 SDR family oxidoreductase [Nonomuraea antri]
MPELAKAHPFAEWIARAGKRQALTGHSTPADIAGAVTFPASHDARFITGVILPVDGGTTAASGQPDFY